MGGAGFLGINLGKALVREGHRVRIFDRTASINRLRGMGCTEFEWAVGDFTNIEDVNNAIGECEIIFHLVSTTLPKSSNLNPANDIETNVISTIRMLDTARKKNVRMVLFASSGGTIYGIPNKIPVSETDPTEPVCSYAIGKLTIEKYLHLYSVLYGLEYRILRISNPYGEEQPPDGEQGAIAVFLARALKNQIIDVWGDGSVVRDFVYVGDVAKAFLKAMSYRGSHRLFNIGAGEGKSINELLSAIELLLGKNVKRNYLASREFDVPVNMLDISRARSELGWHPDTPLSEGLKETLKWQAAM